MGGNLEEMGNELFHKAMATSRKSVNVLRACLRPAREFPHESGRLVHPVYYSNPACYGAGSRTMHNQFTDGSSYGSPVLGGKYSHSFGIPMGLTGDRTLMDTRIHEYLGPSYKMM